MNNQEPNAGQSVREMARGRRRRALWYILLMTVVLGVIIILGLNSQIVGAVGGLGFLALLFLLRIVFAFAEGRADRAIKGKNRAVRGAQAEENIGLILNQLGANFFVLHDVSSQFGNIDHVVISQTGAVMLLETKSHHGTVTVHNEQLLLNGRFPEKDFIAQALKNTYWLKECIDHQVGFEVWITPLIVFTNAFVAWGIPPVKNVKVVNQRYLSVTIKQMATRSTNELVWENREKIRQALRA